MVSTGMQASSRYEILFLKESMKGCESAEQSRISIISTPVIAGRRIRQPRLAKVVQKRSRSPRLNFTLLR
jgi:hypothetical protein